ncbi:MAG: hypothetical protein RLZZ140_1094 [Pseudomonadota bacterium]|jgi:hypothetical protein
MEFKGPVRLAAVKKNRYTNDRKVRCDQGKRKDCGPLPARQAVANKVPSICQ